MIVSTIAAIATPNASGGIGVIRISGEDAISVAEKVFRPVNKKNLSSLKGYTAAFGHVYDGERLLDECVALVFLSPKSYTGENVVELSCHGGLYVTQMVLRAVLSQGAVPAQPGEFTKRAYMNGKIDLAEAESVMNIISARGQQALNAAMTVLEGKLSEKVSKITKELAAVSAAMAVWTDDPDEDIPEAHEENVRLIAEKSLNALNKLINDFDCGQAVTEGVKTVICGHPNVGKSTIMNLLTGYDRSIVTSVPGTTRDIVEETVLVGDIVLHLADTAGIRESQDEAESIGIDRAIKLIDRAELIIAVFDGSESLNDEDLRLLEKCRNRRAVAVINKTDLQKKIDENVIKEYIPQVAEISASNGTGIDSLNGILEKILGTDELDTSSGMLASERQRACCKNAADSLKEAIFGMDSGITLDAVNVSIDYAIEQLLELTGEKARDAVVSELFSKFCVGK